MARWGVVIAGIGPCRSGMPEDVDQLIGALGKILTQAGHVDVSVALDCGEFGRSSSVPVADVAVGVIETVVPVLDVTKALAWQCRLQGHGPRESVGDDPGDVDRIVRAFLVKLSAAGQLIAAATCGDGGDLNLLDARLGK